MLIKNISVVFLAFVITLTHAQQSYKLPSNVANAYKRETRTNTGLPGKNYWQNTADYNLNIFFNPATRLLEGQETIIYTNNSPDTLRQMFFKLYPNLYKKGSIRDMGILESDAGEGVAIDSMYLDGTPLSGVQRRIGGTNMFIRLPKAVIPGQKVTYTIAWHYTLNKRSHIRTGEIDPGADFVAYFFPRIAVYDDIDGWNQHPYLGSEEFYNDFCHFKAAITVPGSQVVWATGNLLNGADVLAAKNYQRLQQAEKNDGIINVIDSADLANNNFTTHNHAFNTWQYEADNVTDFAFACSDHYLWQSSSLVVDPADGRRTRVDAVFNPKHKSYYSVIHEARKTVEAMSYQFPKWPYPYPHETVFDGLDQMEYPMMVNDNPVEDHDQSIELTDHEIFHTMFPFYMGINETKYSWMDEGWATIGEWLVSPMIDSTIVDLYGVYAVAVTAGKEADVPVTTLSNSYGDAYFINSYPKPAMGYLFIKDMLGEETFTKALHYYIQQWHGKHPIPYDFFNCINAGSGKNLDWFWQRWFMQTGGTDLAIAGVKTGKKPAVTIKNVGGMPLPVELQVTFADGSRQNIYNSIAVWEKGNTTIVVPLPKGKDITKIVLGGPHTPDGNKADNEWAK